MITRRAFHALLGSTLAGAALPVTARAAVEKTCADGTSAGNLEAAPPGLAAAQARLAAKLVAALAGRGPKSKGGGLAGGGNVVISPMSAALSLSVVALLAGDAMRRSLGDALQLAGDAKVPFDALLRQGRAFGACREGSPLAASDLLLVDRDAEAFPFALDGMRMRDVAVVEDDLASPDSVARANDWVKAHTGGLIPTIIDGPPGRGGLVALNALHFKDRWAVPFDPALTASAPFHGTDGRVVPVRMMARETSALFRQSASLGAVDLRFADPRFSLVLVTRREGASSAAALVEEGGAWLSGEGFEAMQGEVALPRLDLSATTDLLPVMVGLGLKNAPLAGLAARPPTLRAVTQRAVLTVDETGAEAAAATAATATRSLSTSFVKLRFDKPFLFALRDRTTGFMILAGHVGQVLAAA